MQRQKAIVIGASMAGLLAARVCAQHFSEVLILEKDKISDQPIHRKGVPQDHQIHILLSKGYRFLSHYFPGIIDEVVKKGAIAGDLGLLLKWHCEGGLRPQCKVDEPTAMMSRPLLEDTVRKCLLRLPNVRIKDQTKCIELEYQNDRVVGLKTNDETIKSDLVIDASGMGSRLVDRLAELGFSKPEIEKVKVNVKYSSFVFPRDANFAQMINTNANPPYNTRHGTIQPIEDNKMVAMVQGRTNDEAPTDLASFKAYAQSLETAEIYHKIKDLEPVSELTQYHIPFVRWIHFEKLKQFPEGILPLGDAICRLNPVYGQGISSAAIQAEALDKVLQNSNHSIWKEYFRRVAKEVKTLGN